MHGLADRIGKIILIQFAASLSIVVIGCSVNYKVSFRPRSWSDVGWANLGEGRTAMMCKEVTGPWEDERARICTGIKRAVKIGEEIRIQFKVKLQNRGKAIADSYPADSIPRIRNLGCPAYVTSGLARIENVYPGIGSTCEIDLAVREDSLKMVDEFELLLNYYGDLLRFKSLKMPWVWNSRYTHCLEARVNRVSDSPLKTSFRKHLASKRFCA